MRETILNQAYNSVVAFVRAKHVEEIDEAYDYFWEEEDPADFLGGRPLELGFMNFEDWLVCDYRPGEAKGFIDRFIEDSRPDKEMAAVLEGLRTGSVFATRLIDVEGEKAMGRCVYPFADRKALVLDSLEGQFRRYQKHKNPGSSMADFLADETYAFNTIWVSCLNL
ncbi:MAG: hypothetical protein P8Y39_03640 [Nitrospirota bacterium]